MFKKIAPFLTFLLLSASLDAKCVDDRLSLTLPDNTLLSQAINIMAKECRFSVVYSDRKTKSIIQGKTLSPIDINRKEIDYIFDVLLSRNNLHYEIEDDILTISYVATKTFKVDYIDSTRTGNSNTDVIISGSSATSTTGGTTTGGTATTAAGAGTATAGATTGGTSNSGSTGAYIQTTESFDFWQDLSSNLHQIVERPEDEEDTYRSTLIINKKSGQVIATGTKKQLDRIEKYIKEVLDALRKQVIIDVKIVSVALDKSHSVGIDWSNFSLDLGLTGTLLDSVDDQTLNGVKTKTESNSIVIDKSASLEMGAFFNFLRGYGETRSLSNPKILAINNQPSMISVGDNINYLVTSTYTTGTTTTATSESQLPQSLFVGVLLDITPQIDDEGFITLRINPSISEFKYSEDAVKQTTVRNLPPDTVTRRISSVVRVKDGDSIILGGLISSTKGEVENKVRLLGDIPYLGRLFKSTQTTDIVTEIIFVLTPHLATVDKIPSLDELGFETIIEKTDLNATTNRLQKSASNLKTEEKPTKEKTKTEEIPDTIPYNYDEENR
ncbi:MAG: ral secretion pathway protein [Campylobacterota bacterium]|nr:ral secretion pathway protein [Campylobacterota bacterium]